MKSFTDNLGRTWTLVVNVVAIKRGVYFYSFFIRKTALLGDITLSP